MGGNRQMINNKTAASNRCSSLFFCCGIINNSMSWINKDFKKDWENTSPENKRHVIKLIIILGALTLVPVICIACSMATGAMWLNEP